MICNAHSVIAVKQLNEQIKKRSKFRPVAPAILERNAKKYFLAGHDINNIIYKYEEVFNNLISY